MTVVVVGEGGEAPPGEAPVSEPVAEAVTDAAVEIAEIEANRDITLAVIAAETQEAQAEAFGQERVTALQSERDALWTENLSLREQVGNLEAQVLTLLPSPEPEPPPNPTPPADEPPAPMPVSQEAPEPPPEPAQKRKPLRFI
jgi:hypothetical protein